VDLYSASSWSHLLRRSGMARVLEGSHSFTCTPCVHPLTEWTIPAFAFPAEAVTHLPTPSTLGGWLVTYRNISVRHRELNPETVAHLSTNRARRRLTSLFEANALTTTPDHQPAKQTAMKLHQTKRTACYYTPSRKFLASNGSSCYVKNIALLKYQK